MRNCFNAINNIKNGDLAMPIRKLFILVIIVITATFLLSPNLVTAKSSTGDSSVSSKTTKSKKNSKKSSKKSTKSKKKTSKKSVKKDKKTKKDTKAKKSSSKSAKKSTKAKAGKVNINSATAKELTAIAGVGPVTAKSIIAYRKKHGKFKNANDLLNVKGIGDATMKKMKKQLKF